jgi:hypothetical protein
LPPIKNVQKLFDAIAAAKVPEGFTHNFLSNTLGLKGNTDRPMISLLKAQGFLEPGGKPTPAYSLLKNKDKAKHAIAEGIKQAYKPLFDANEKAYELSPDTLRGLVAQVAGTDGGMTNKIAGTFNALVKSASFDSSPIKAEKTKAKEENTKQETDETSTKTLRPEFHYNIQVHLPSNGTEETYLSIFNALRKSFS